MAAETTRIVGDKYILPTGSQDAARLDLIHSVYGPISYRGLEAAGIGEAQRVADIGCGTGTLSRWMASRIGAAGQVDSIDIAEEQIEIAKAIPSASGSAPIAYRVGSAYEPGLPAGCYDIVFCRLVLCHLKEPARAVQEMARLLKPGGRLVLVDMDLRDIFTMPLCDAFADFNRELTTPLEAKLQVNYSIGLKLPQLLQEAGVPAEAIMAEQPIYREGPEKYLWTKTWTSVLPRATPDIATPGRGKALIDRMEEHLDDPHSWMAVAKMFAAIGRKPQ